MRARKSRQIQKLFQHDEEDQVLLRIAIALSGSLMTRFIMHILGFETLGATDAPNKPTIKICHGDIGRVGSGRV